MNKENYYIIEKLELSDFDKCSNIWNMEKQVKLANKFQNEIKLGIRTTYIYKENNEFLGEISLVTKKDDADYTIEGTRIYLSRIMVKKAYRGKKIGTKLIEYALNQAKRSGYKEISLGVDLDNYVALKLYFKFGFDKILYVGEDKDGKYVKLLKKIVVDAEKECDISG